jgi:hypothetical protein
MSIEIKAKGKGLFDKLKKGGTFSYRQVKDKDGVTYMAIKLDDGSFHIFTEINARQAARDCGIDDEGKLNSRQMWEKLWK